MKTDMAEMFLGAVHVDRFRGDIHVSTPDRRAGRRQVLSEITLQTAVPLQLVLMLWGADLVAVRNVGVDDRNAAHDHAHQASVIDLGKLVIETVKHGIRWHSG